MRAMFAVLGLLLITSGAIVLGAPYLAQYQAPEAAIQGEGPSAQDFAKRRPVRPRQTSWFDRVQVIAEKANAPLSIIFGFMSLYYTRRTYHARSNS